MLRRIDLRQGLGNVSTMLPRAAVDVSAAVSVVAPLVDDVRRRGSAAIQEATMKFDGVRPTSIRVPGRVIDDAAAALRPDVRSALLESIARARIGHQAQLPTERVTQITAGGTVTQRWVPVRRVGLY